MSDSKESRQSLCYIGSYTQFQGRTQTHGIQVCQFDQSNGRLTKTGEAGGIVNSSFLALHPSREYLYAVSETKAGHVQAYSLKASAEAPVMINGQLAHGDAPCQLVVDRSGRFVFVANYSSGTIAVLPIRADGGLDAAVQVIQHEGSGPHERRQTHPYAHSIWQDPSGRFFLACDLGCDKVFVYRFDAQTGRLTPNDPASGQLHPGAGPRHLDFHPNGRFAYVINEIDSTLTAFAWDAESGSLVSLQTVSTLPPGFSGSNTCADIHVSPSGRFVYGSNRGHDSIVVFAVDEKTGTLALVQHQASGGRCPRNFAVDPSGSYLLAAHQDSDSIVTFEIDADTGRLSPNGNIFEVGMPVCIKFA